MAERHLECWSGAAVWVSSLRALQERRAAGAVDARLALEWTPGVQSRRRAALLWLSGAHCREVRRCNYSTAEAALLGGARCARPLGGVAPQRGTSCRHIHLMCPHITRLLLPAAAALCAHLRWTERTLRPRAAPSQPAPVPPVPPQSRDPKISLRIAGTGPKPRQKEQGGGRHRQAGAGQAAGRQVPPWRGPILSNSEKAQS